MRTVSAVLGLLFCVWGTTSTHAQLLSTRLPTPQGGDYGNGVATSDVVGGVFIHSAKASPAPAAAHGIPTGFGADWGDVFAGAGYQRGLRFDRDFNDGAVFGGVGFGHARRAIGVELTLGVFDLVGDTFADRTIGVKVHRRLSRRWAVAVGIENMIVTGRTDGGTSAYGVVSGLLPLRTAGKPFSTLTLTAGIGDGRFNPVENVRRDRNIANLFGGIAFGLIPRINGVASWTGQDLNVGISVAPFSRLPFVVTPVLLDVAGRAESAARIAVSAGVGITL